ncbi:integrase/recombinase XerC [Halopolyspora algeriensis]|uniref:Integrase/recombinase XerC n=1 Tax=Halopolyspora algeriensis TaxID=1500506 RepID=A0A368VWC2_9ACTN|nr:tyrosine-type recombinase/integrase [Halopolyspora algeriensis]RCW46149.1 integrase/recombinase XerC [Halopolyspora algeriensis]TQM55552.1 integrase/recombinase XerC [Halopolyspora algeriensis]
MTVPAAEQPAEPGRPGSSSSPRSHRILAEYRAALARANLSDDARRAYASRVAGFLDWLATGRDPQAGDDPLREAPARDAAVRDYRAHLKTVRRAKPNTINAVLTALDHFYTHHLGLGRPVACRENRPATAPAALDEGEQRRFLQAVQQHASTRDRAIVLMLLYAGLRAEELARLDVADVPVSARRGTVLVRAGRGRDRGTRREVQLHRAAREAVHVWLQERSSWPGSGSSEALWLNRRGGRLSVRSVNTIVREIAVVAGLVHESGAHAGKARVHPHTLRHTFAAQLLRSGVDVVTVADLMGHAKLDSTRVHARSSSADRSRAIDTALVTGE